MHHPTIYADLGDLITDVNHAWMLLCTAPAKLFDRRLRRLEVAVARLQQAVDWTRHHYPANKRPPLWAPADDVCREWMRLRLNTVELGETNATEFGEAVRSAARTAARLAASN